MEENISCDENQHCINDETHGVCVCDIGFKPMALHPEAKYEVHHSIFQGKFWELLGFNLR